MPALDFILTLAGGFAAARLDVAHSREGWQVFFKLSDPFRLSRRSLRTSVIPFVP